MKNTIDKIITRILLIIGRGILKAVNDDDARQFVQFTALRGEIKDNVERVQNYGVSCNPISGAQVLFACVGGNRDHPIVFAVDDPRYRPNNLKSGEVVIYTDEGDKIHLKRGNEIKITTLKLTVKASDKIRFETPRFECTGDIIDQVDASSITIQEMRNIYNSHNHTGDSGGTTSNPQQAMGN